jgi:hypothetical protein
MWAKAMQKIQDSLAPGNFDDPPKRQPTRVVRSGNDDDRGDRGRGRNRGRDD